MQYSPDIIRRYREMEDTRAFLQDVSEHTPVDLDCDRVTLTCGHQQFASRHVVEAREGKVHCQTCRQEWLAKAVEEEQRGGPEK
jgi:hypothetical protein